MSRINNIENNLNSNPSSISTSDLIYYLQYTSNNNQLNPNNIEETQTYLNQINNSYNYENIFVNTSNYTSIMYTYIGLLIPFYFFYPRFYNLNTLGCLIGIISFVILLSLINKLYGSIFNNIAYVFFGLTFTIYILFFILLNKLNHISLFFISAIISFFFINYVCRIILTVPTKNNEYNQLKATMNNNTNYTQYNVLIEQACFQIIDRFNLKLPSGNMLYSYLTVFDMGTNTNKIADFMTNLFGPIISISMLYLLSKFLNNIKENDINILPIIGLKEDSDKMIFCQANYILPKELNVNLLIHSFLDKYGFDNKLYDKVQLALNRISNELLKKYNPKFINLNDTNKETILENLKNNKIFIQINKILHKTNTNFDLNYMDEIKKAIDEDKISYKEKEKMYSLLDQINNTLLIQNKENVNYHDDALLAINELLYDKEIDNKYKGLLKNIVDDYLKQFTDNLNLKNGILFGYDYNIITYPLFNPKVREVSNKLFAFIIGIISTWLLFTKPLGSPWLITRYIMTEKNGIKTLLKNLSGDWKIWKYIGMGLDRSYIEEITKDFKNNDNNMIQKGLNIIYSILLFLLITPIFYMYNSVSFGLNLSPSWYNILYQIVFVVNIIGNIISYNNKYSLVLYNLYFFIAFLIIFLLIGMIFLIINRNKWIKFNVFYEK